MTTQLQLIIIIIIIIIIISVKGTVYPLHSPVSPSLPLPCVTVCHHISVGVCLSVLEHLMSPLCSRVSGVTKHTAGLSVWPKHQNRLLYRGNDIRGSLSFTFCLAFCFPLSLVTLKFNKYIYMNYTVETFANTCQVIYPLVCAVSGLGIAVSHLVNVFPYFVKTNGGLEAVAYHQWH